MNITFTLPDCVVQSYLNHFNDIEGTDYTVETLTEEVKCKIVKEFGDISKGEIVMRTDDHSGFETETIWEGIL